MILCDKDCVPCCDYCTYSQHELIFVNGRIIKGAPIGCNKHCDEEHLYIVQGCGYCEDFRCKNVKDDISSTR